MVTIVAINAPLKLYRVGNVQLYQCFIIVIILHIGEITHKAHQSTDAILRCFTTRDNALTVAARVHEFITHVRPLFIASFGHRTFSAVEKVQKTFTKGLSGLKINVAMCTSVLAYYRFISA